MEIDRVQDLDPAVWSNLPQQFREMIYARLPCRDFFRLRSVCKSWNELVHSPAFLNAHPAPPFQDPSIFWVTETSEGFFTFDAHRNKWLCRPTPQFSLKCYAKASGAAGHHFYRLYQETEGGDWRVRIFNFLTKVWQELPPMVMTLRTLHLHTLVLDNESQSYRLFVVGGEGDGKGNGAMEKVIQMYDSSCKQWTFVSSYQRGFGMFSRLIHHNGTLYEGTETAYQRYKVCAFDLEKKSWRQVRAVFPNDFFNDLMTSGSHLLMVGATNSGVHIWELHSSPSEHWKELSCIDDSLLELYKSEMYPAFVNNVDSLCFDSYGCGDFVLFVGSIARICMPQKFLLYKVSTNAWIQLTDEVDVLPDSSRYLINNSRDNLAA